MLKHIFYLRPYYKAFHFSLFLGFWEANPRARDDLGYDLSLPISDSLDVSGKEAAPSDVPKRKKRKRSVPSPAVIGSEASERTAEKHPGHGFSDVICFVSPSAT